MVVAVVAILAAIAIPAWLRDSAQKKARSEVSTMFAEIATKEEQYMAENSTWFPTGTTGAQYSTGFCPSTPNAAGNLPDPCIASGQPWYQLRIGVPSETLMCSYNIYTGDPTVAPALPSELSSWVQMPASPPSTNWFFIEAHCDMDGSTTTDSYYYFSSFDSRIQVTNEGS